MILNYPRSDLIRCVNEIESDENAMLAEVRAHRYFFGVLKFCLGVIALSSVIICAACAKIALPPQITMSEVEPSGKAAKPSNCEMPVLRSDPAADYREVAIIEGLGNRFVQESDVLPLVVAKSCETGADAIVIHESRAQTSEDMTGYYINAIAIIYGKKRPTLSGIR
jgi:hypothetical protein